MPSSPEMTRAVATRWFDALRTGNGEAALACLDENVHWINNPPEPGLSAIIPWLGDFHGRNAVQQTFIVWSRLSSVEQFELLQLNVNGEEVLAIVHEVALVKATEIRYDIEFIQRFRVANDRIVFWKSYWDTVKGIVPFRGNMAERLIAAAETGSMDEAMLVLPFGADPNTRDPSSGQTVLMLASGRGHIDLVRTLLQHGADPNALDLRAVRPRAGTASLHKACQGGHFEVAKALVEAGAYVDLQVPTTGHTPIVEAIWFAADDIVEYLLEKGARIDLDTNYGFTIDQHIAYALGVNQGSAAGPRLQRIKQLVATKRERDAAAAANEALFGAVNNADAEGVRTAIRAGANIEQRKPLDRRLQLDGGNTPLLIAARLSEKHADVVSALIELGADVNATEPVFGAVPLHKATYHGWTEVTRRLAASADVDVNYQGPSNGYTPLHDALWHAKPECAAVLLNDPRVRIDLRGYDGKLPIDVARATLGPEHPIVRQLAKMSTART